MYELRIDFLSLREADGERCIERGAWCCGAQMQSVVCAIHVIEDIIHSCLEDIFQVFLTSQLMGSVESPNLVSLSVSIELIVTLGGHLPIDANSEMIDGTE